VKHGCRKSEGFQRLKNNSHQGRTLRPGEAGLSGRRTDAGAAASAPVPARKGTDAEQRHQRSARALPAHVQREAPYPDPERKGSFRSATKRPRARPLSSERSGAAAWCPLPLALFVVAFRAGAIPETRYLAQTRDDPSIEGARYEGVTRYASNTASMLRNAVNRLRSSFTSPTSATYQFFAIWSSTVPP